MNDDRKDAVDKGRVQEDEKKEFKEDLAKDGNDGWGDKMEKSNAEIRIGYANVNRLWIKPKKIGRKKKKTSNKKRKTKER